MGNLLIIKGADFSENAIEHVTPPTPPTPPHGPIYTLQNKVYNGTNYDATQYELFGSSMPDWTLFVDWSNNTTPQSGQLWGFWGNTENNGVCGICCDNIGVGYNSTSRVGREHVSGVTALSDKFALRRTNNIIYYSLDGTTWEELMSIANTTNRRNLAFGARADGAEFGAGTIVKAELYDESLSDISELFV